MWPLAVLLGEEYQRYVELHRQSVTLDLAALERARDQASRRADDLEAHAARLEEEVSTLERILSRRPD
jgi:uncharacterized protein YceH (UPF0502 family)